MLKTSDIDSLRNPSLSLTLLLTGLLDLDLVLVLECPLPSPYLSLCFPSFLGLRRTILRDLGLGYLVHVPLGLLLL